MASKSERLITEALGSPLETSVIAFTDSSASGVLDINETYRLAATEDCYIDLNTDGTAATVSGVLMFAGVPEVFTTTAQHYVLHAIRKDTSGNLHATRMTSRGQ